MKRPLKFFVLAAFGFQGNVSFAETTVTTYVTRTVEEKKSTRFTLDEWLKTKERMRLMDVWLAMVTDANKAKFRPELSFEYQNLHGTHTVERSDQSSSAQAFGTKIWLTNLVSGTTGVRTLNIDLGGEFRHKEGISKNNSSHVSSKKIQYATGSLRLIGKSSQDSSLTLKYGRFSAENPLLTSSPQSETKRVGPVAGADLQLYITHFLGAEGTYTRFGTGSSLKQDLPFEGWESCYSGFVEISVLRLGFGMFDEKFSHRSESGITDVSREQGYVASLKLLL